MNSNPILYSTTDYSIFSHILGQRSVNKNHVGKLIDSIKRDDRLKYKPIEVKELYIENKKSLAIIDGQHRLEAAKKLNKEIYYFINENPYEMAIADNQIQKKWGLEDYLNYYCEKKFTEYLKFKNLMEKYDCSLQFIFVLISGRKFDLSDKFKRGNIKIPTSVIEFLEIVTPHFKELKKSFNSEKCKTLFRRDFLQALFSVFVNDRKKCISFLTKLNYKFGRLSDKADKKTYLEQIDKLAWR
jgi:hypothetical protein